MQKAAKELVFYYDIICPYAYLASRLVEGVAESTGAEIKWRPVLLGGIYKATKPAAESATKAYEKMNSAKQLVLSKDLLRQYNRCNVSALPINKMPDLSTLHTMKLLAACPDETSDLRINITHELYHSLWAEKKDVSDMSLLKEVAKKFNWNVDVEAIVTGKDLKGKELLYQNTNEAIERGAFGVPSFWVNNQLYFGADRLDFVRRVLGEENATPQRLFQQPTDLSKKRKLKIFHDFASPWCYVASRRIQNLIDSLKPVEVEVEWVPILLGALFNEIGSPQLPLFSQGESKRKYSMRDFQEWIKYLNLDDFQFPSGFPITTLTALRMTIANQDDKLRTAIYDAAWTKNADLGEKEVLANVISEAGFDAEKLFSDAKSQEVKNKLKENTQRAVSLGLCGVPTFQVDDQPIIWGQDRLNIVADELCGWKDNVDEVVKSIMNSKL
eukprot:gene11057-12224_t